MKTLLKTVQLILASLDSDEVNDINDTVESRQVVDLIEQAWTDLTSQIEFPEFYDFFKLEPSLDPAKPTLMRLPDHIGRVEWIRYNVEDDEQNRRYQEVCYMPRAQFFKRMDSLKHDDPTVYRYNYEKGGDLFDVRGWSNRNPNYYTTPDTRTILFDSYRDTHTSVSARTHCYGQVLPVFKAENDWVLPMDPKQYTLFFNEAKALCFIELKQVENARAERTARRGYIHSQRKKKNTDASPVWDTFTNNYGRRGKW